ncbi:ParB N-terminal domain-containing protein, partial [Anaerostipes hadrus]|nr:ParB N-terminal domain-containing protein [Anaerostipes hadrus]
EQYILFLLKKRLQNQVKKKNNMSLQSNSVKPTEIPLSEIRRPLAPVLDPQKIDAMVATMKGIPTASKTCSLEQAEAAA